MAQRKKATTKAKPAEPEESPQEPTDAPEDSQDFPDEPPQPQMPEQPRVSQEAQEALQQEEAVREAKNPWVTKDFQGRQVTVHIPSGRMYDPETGEEISSGAVERKRSAKREGMPSKPTKEQLSNEGADRYSMNREELNRYRRRAYEAFRAEQMAVGNMENVPKEMPADFIPPDLTKGTMPRHIQQMLQDAILGQ